VERITVQLRFLGAHQSEAIDRRFTGLLIDGWLAIDAGSLATGLTLDEQLAVSDVLITHQHWDHVKDLGGFGFNRFSAKASGREVAAATVYCTEDVRRIVSERLFGDGFWLDFFHSPAAQPTFGHETVVPGSVFAIRGYQIQAVPVNHSVPVNGYQVTDRAGRSVYYTGDNGPGCGQYWARAQPELLITECTYSNAPAELEGGSMHGHLWPKQLGRELATFRETRGYLPRVAVLHVNPFYHDRVEAELAVVARELGAAIDVAFDGMISSL
jgi:ribonuclease BN (tRNA processing enzyme)